MLLHNHLYINFTCIMSIVLMSSDHSSITVHYYVYFLHTLPCNTMSSTPWNNIVGKSSNLFYHSSIAVHYYLYFLHTLSCNTMSSTSWNNTVGKLSDLFYHSSITVRIFFIPFHVTPCPPPPGLTQEVSGLIFSIILLLYCTLLCVFYSYPSM